MKYTEEQFKAEVVRLYEDRYNIYVPKKWPHESSTECFKEDLLDLILKNL